MAVTKVYNGSLWTTGKVKVWTGSAWEDNNKIWNGSSWVLINNLTTYTVTLTNRLISGPIKTDGTNSTATFTLNAAGTTLPAVSGEWLDPADDAEADQYQARYTNFSGSALLAQPAAVNVWFSMTVNRSWQLRSTNEGYKYCSFTVEIRKGTGSVLDSATIELEAQSSGGGGP